jgi:hypothetical protein
MSEDEEEKKGDYLITFVCDSEGDMNRVLYRIHNGGCPCPKVFWGVSEGGHSPSCVKGVVTTTPYGLKQLGDWFKLPYVTPPECRVLVEPITAKA